MWVKVEDMLPNPKDMNNITVLVCIRSKVTNRPYAMEVARWNGIEWISNGKVLEMVTHWMPLPELPPKS